jgi:hypothetical protein
VWPKDASERIEWSRGAGKATLADPPEETLSGVARRRYEFDRIVY